MPVMILGGSNSPVSDNSLGCWNAFEDSGSKIAIIYKDLSSFKIV